VVFGATGAQGGSVFRNLVRQGNYTVRAVTRDANSSRAQDLKKHPNVEVVSADLSDPKTISAALKNSSVVFGVTNYWEHFDKELDHGKNIIDCCAENGVSNLVISTFMSAKLETQGKIEAPHTDIKGQIELYAKSKLSSLPSTCVRCAFYYENFLSLLIPQKQNDGTYLFGFPQRDIPLPGFSAKEDTGPVVEELFNQGPKEWSGQVFGIVGDVLTGDQYAEIMSKVLGKKIRYQHIDREVYAKLPFTGADDLANMFDFQATHAPFFGGRLQI